MLNHQMFLQQQQNIDTLMAKVEELTKDAENKMSALTDGKTVTLMQNRVNTITKTHMLLDVSSDRITLLQREDIILINQLTDQILSLGKLTASGHIQ